MFISGDKIGLDADTCYLAIFSHGKDNHYWYVGAHFMSDYVTILDNSRTDPNNVNGK